jgi:hypothetical protein
MISTKIPMREHKMSKKGMSITSSLPCFWRFAMGFYRIADKRLRGTRR